MLELTFNSYKALIQRGGIRYIESLSPHLASKSIGLQPCRLCKKTAKRRQYVIAEASGRRVFEEIFDCKDCANLAIEWLKILVNAYYNYLRSPKDGSKFTEDDFRNPIMIDDDESLRDFKARYHNHLEELAELTPEIDLESGEKRFEDLCI